MSTHPADGEAVAMWDDEGDATGNAFGDSITKGKPVYRAGAFNGRGCLEFDGTKALRYVDDGYSAFQNDATLISASAFTVFASFILESPATNNSPFYQNTPLIANLSGYWGIHLTTISSVHRIYAYNYDGSIGNGAGAIISLNTPYVVMIKHDSGSMYLDVNNGALTDSFSSGNTAGNADLGLCVGLNGDTFPGKLGEMAIWNAALTGGDLSDAWAYFMGRWMAPAGNPWYVYAQQRIMTALRSWQRRGPLWVPACA